MRKPTIYGSWTPNFPDILYCTTVVLHAPKKGWAVLTSERTYVSVHEAEKFCQKFALGLRSSGMKFEYGLIMALSMHRSWELHKRYWNSEQHMNFSDTRQQLFQTMLEKFEPEAWSVIVTPTKYRNRREYWAGMPVLNTKIDTDTEAFMSYSDWPVDPTASHAGIYSVEDIAQVDVDLKRVRKQLKK